MKAPGVEQALGLVASQLEAASSLLKFAADDLNDLLAKSEMQLMDEVRMIIQNLHAQSAVLDGHAAFCERLGEAEEDESDDQSGATQLRFVR